MKKTIVPQTVEITKVDVQKVAAGYRASKVIGSSVLNDANETIGKIDDLLVTRDGKEPYAVLSIGGFLGMGTHMVVIRYDSLKFADNKIVLPGGSKDGKRGKSRGSQAVAQRCLTIAGKYGTSGWFGTARREPR